FTIDDLLRHSEEVSEIVVETTTTIFATMDPTKGHQVWPIEVRDELWLHYRAQDLFLHQVVRIEYLWLVTARRGVCCFDTAPCRKLVQLASVTCCGGQRLLAKDVTAGG